MSDARKPPKNGVRFSASNQPEGRGRRPNKLKKFIKDNRISKNDVNAMMSCLLFSKTLDELQNMTSKDNRGKLPVGVACLVQALYTDAKNGKHGCVDSMLDRLYGKPCQSVEVAEYTSDIPSDPDERAALAERIKAQIDAGASGD